jgi:hypothetical protein
MLEESSPHLSNGTLKDASEILSNYDTKVDSDGVVEEELEQGIEDAIIKISCPTCTLVPAFFRGPRRHNWGLPMMIVGKIVMQTKNNLTVDERIHNT